MSLLYTFFIFCFCFSFPGGKVDASDDSRSHTAIRECEEELGIRRDQVDVWAELQHFPDRVSETIKINDIL